MATGNPVVWALVRELGRTGVPIVLERVLRASGRGASVHVVAMRGGPLRERMSAVASTCTLLEPDQRRSLANVAAVGAREVGAGALGDALQHAVWRHRLRSLPSPDVVLVHGAGAWSLLPSVPGDPPIVLHVHELDIGLDRSIPRSAQAAAFARASRVLVVSRPVADLAVRRGADPFRVELLPGVADTPPAPSATDRNRSSRGVPVMGAGVPGWRKGTDRVAAVAHELSRRGRDGVVGWVGGAPTGSDSRWASAVDPVRWFSETDDPWELMDDAEVVLVPSREDPLPLVALEAGRRAKAVVATPTGGLVDLLADGRGAVAPAHDVAWLAERVASLLERPDERAALGAALAAEVAANHDAEAVASTWWSVLCDAAGGARPGSG